MGIWQAYLGNAFGICAGLYLLIKGGKLSGPLVVAGFCFVLQSMLVTRNWPLGSDFQACQMIADSYTSCLPVLYRVSFYAGQIGGFLIPTAILLLAHTFNKPKKSDARIDALARIDAKQRSELLKGGNFQ